MGMGKKKAPATHRRPYFTPVEKAGGVSQEAGAPVSGDATRRITAAAGAMIPLFAIRTEEAAAVRSNRRI
jgi:hypothetical protein